MSAILKVESLNVTLQHRRASKKLVEDVSFEVRPGECLGILGESGSGKSMTVKSVLGLLDKNFQVSGSAIFDGQDPVKGIQGRTAPPPRKPDHHGPAKSHDLF